MMISRGFSFKKIVPKPWRRAVAVIAGLFLLALIPGTYFALRNPNIAQAAWFDTSWAFRKKIPITTHTSPETNVYFAVTVDTSDPSRFQADCGDMRFTDAYGKLLKYFIVSGCGSSSTVTHVLVPNFPGGVQNFYMYYGNPSAPNGFSAADFANAATVTVGSVASEENGAGPIAYWDFNEGTGTTAHDQTTSGNTGTLGASTAAPTWGSKDLCVSGKCLFFDGGNDVVNGNSNSSLKLQSHTLSGWVKMNSFSGVNHKIIASYASDITVSGVEWGVNSSGYLSFAYNDGSVRGWYEDTATPLAASKWYYVTIAWDKAAGQVKFYVNGNLSSTISTTTGTIVYGSEPLVIGYQSQNDYLNGWIDELRIYNYTRSAAQIKSGYQSAMAGVGNSTVVGLGTQSALSDGLVGYWKLDDPFGLTRDCSTAPFIDSSGNGNNGKSCPSTTGPYGGTVGKIGGAVTFDGSDDYIAVPSSTSLNLATNMTVSAWVKSSDTTNSSRLIISKWNGGGAKNYWFGRLFDRTIGFQVDGGGQNVFTPDTTVVDGNWHLVTGVADSKSKKLYLYIDGKLANSAAYTGTSVTGSTQVEIGRNNESVNDLWNGTIDEARIYNRALSPTEVTQLYNFAPPPVAYWNMEESSGKSLLDITGNGNTGTLTGSPGPLRVAGKYGKGLYFPSNDASALVDLGNSPTIGLSGGITVEAWVNKDPTSGSGFPNIVSKATAGSGDNISYLLYYDGTVSNVRFLIGDNAGNLSGIAQTPVPSTGVWHHLVGTADGTSVKIYIDGVLKDTQSQNVALVNGNLDACIGAFSGNANCDNPKQLGAYVDDVRIYDYARTQAQIVDDMNHPLGNSSPLGAPFIYTKLDEQTGTTEHNSGSNAGSFDGSSSGPTWATGSSCKVNGCMVFGTNNDLITWGDVDFTDSLSTFATSFWMNPSSLGTNRNIISKANITTQRVFEIKTSTGTASELQVMIAANSTDTSNYCTTAGLGLATSTWQHIAIVYDGSQVAANRVKVYKNGKTIPCNVTGTIPTSFVAAGTTSNLKFGQGDDTINALLSSYDEIKVYNVALTSDQVALDYNLGSSNTSGVLGPTEAADINIDGAGNPPVAYWNLDDKYGTSALDKSGNNFTGTLTNGPNWVTGKIGSGIRFDGSNDYVSVTDNNTLDITSGITLSAWVYPRVISGPGTAVGLIDKWASSNFSYSLELVESGGNFIPYMALSSDGTSWSGEVDAGSSIPFNTWSHIEGVYNGTTLKIYVNGVLKGTTNYSSGIFSGSSNVSLGRRFDGGSFTYLNGDLDEAKIYNYARTQGQVEYDYNRGAPLAWWKLDDCQGTSIADSSGNGSTGTLSVGAAGLYSAPGSCASGTASDSWYSGRVGKFNSSIILDGNDNISMGNPTTLQMERTDPRTFSIWFKTINNSSISLMTKQANSAPFAGYNLQTGSAGILDFQLVNTYASNTLEVKSSNNLNYYDGNWHMATVTYDGSSTPAGVKIYYDGKAVTMTTQSNSLSASIATSANLYLGSRSGTGQQLAGSLDDARIYPYAMSDNQVKKLYNDGAAVYYGPATGAP